MSLDSGAIFCIFSPFGLINCLRSVEDERERKMPGPHQGERTGGSPSPLAEISTGTVQLFRKYTGRGPSRARAFTEGNVAFVLLRNTLTPAEYEMVAAGHEDDVLRMRSGAQQAMKAELIALVEDQLGRTVEAFTSHNSVEPDLAVEVFVLDGSKPSD